MDAWGGPSCCSPLSTRSCRLGAGPAGGQTRHGQLACHVHAVSVQTSISCLACKPIIATSLRTAFQSALLGMLMVRPSWGGPAFCVAGQPQIQLVGCSISPEAVSAGLSQDADQTPATALAQLRSSQPCCEPQRWPSCGGLLWHRSSKRGAEIAAGRTAAWLAKLQSCAGCHAPRSCQWLDNGDRMCPHTCVCKRWTGRKARQDNTSKLD